MQVRGGGRVCHNPAGRLGQQPYSNCKLCMSGQRQECEFTPLIASILLVHHRVTVNCAGRSGGRSASSFRRVIVNCVG